MRQGSFGSSSAELYHPLQSDVYCFFSARGSPISTGSSWIRINGWRLWSELGKGNQGQIGTCNPPSALLSLSDRRPFATGLIRIHSQGHDESASIKWLLRSQFQILAQLKGVESCLTACRPDTMSLPAGSLPFMFGLVHGDPD